MGYTKTKGLSPKDLENARQRALAAGELPDVVRRELVLLWQRQDTLPKDLHSFVTATLMPSGWVITHVVPLLAKFLAANLRTAGGEASFAVANRLNDVEKYVVTDVAKAIEILVEPTPNGPGSRKAGHYQMTALRVLDLGLIGLPVIAAVYAKTFGIADVSVSLIAEGNLSVVECVKNAVALDDAPSGELSEGDKAAGDKLWLPSELFSPEDFNPTAVESVPARRL